jgi:hypothetical protein
MNVRINDNGAAFMIEVEGLTVMHFNTLGGAWNHIVWMHRVASQQFTVGKTKLPVEEWIRKMIELGYID